MSLIDKIVNFFNSRQYFLYLLLLLMAVSLFSYLQSDPTFADPDSFYHAKMAVMLAEQGAITEFPWLSATTLKYNFVDHHFLYHLVLIPFVKIFPPLAGLKIATIIFASLTILVIFWFLRQMKVKGAFWYALFLLTVNPFIFRLNLAKAQPLVLITLFLFIYLLFNRRYLSLFLVSSLYVWLYAGWPLAILLVIIYSLINYFWPAKKRSWLIFKRGKIKALHQNFLLLISVGLGLMAGLFFSPYFAKNLQFYWQQSFKIAVVNYQYIIGVGGEWYPYNFLELLLAAGPFFLLFLLAAAVFVITSKNQSMNTWFFLAISFLFFALTLKSRRYVEYFIPLAVCFSALSLNVFLPTLKAKLRKIMSQRLILFGPLVILLVLSPVFYRDLKLIKDFYQDGYSFDKFARPSNWLKQNSKEGDIVFHSDWDEFPILFYHNDKNYYLSGLDPTFMYEYNQSLYRSWVNITTGQSDRDLHSIIKDVFGAKYVFVDINQNADFDRNLTNNIYFQQVFENKEARVYQVSD